MNSRNKRGLINIFGTGLKLLFGTMEDNDAQLISESFDKIYNNSANTTLLVRNQTSIVKNILSQVSNFDYQYNESMKI